jgi:hypothetical protein
MHIFCKKPLLLYDYEHRLPSAQSIPLFDWGVSYTSIHLFFISILLPTTTSTQ